VADAERITFVEGTEVVVLEAAALTVTPQGGSRALTRTTHLSTQRHRLHTTHLRTDKCHSYTHLQELYI